MTVKIIAAAGEAAWHMLYEKHLTHLPPREQMSMWRHIHNSYPVWIGSVDEDILGVYGLLAPTVLSDRAFLWLSVTQHLGEHAFLFTRYSQRVLEDMLKLYPIIVGHTDWKNKKAQKWLRWLGAEMQPRENDIVPFEIRADTWHNRHSELLA